MGLLYRLSKPEQAIAWEGDMPITSRYTMGIAGERFFRAILDDEALWGTCCPECDVVYVPPRLYCERCFAQLDEWVEVPNTGYVYTYTIVHVDMDGNTLEDPRIMAYVRLEGTDGGLVHFLGEVDPEDVGIGMLVEAVFKDKAERKGSINDIAYFRPI
ncbi:MAG: Zn-ribbon domain-containing OB-fold protein [Anaerolineae bacterium]|nr:Zn-ribbon domain-containing OB-fold protein [Anaerolineae bacterium]